MAAEAWYGCSEERTMTRCFPRSAGIPKQIKPEQAELIYQCMIRYNQEGNIILEIGTRAGYSASIIAQAAPLAQIITLEPIKERVILARKHLREFPNVTVVKALSWEYLQQYKGPALSAIFVDGDHKHAQNDIPWFYKLKSGGLMLFHDYTEHGSYPVVRAVDLLAATLNKELDIKVIDTEGAGMAGLYR